MAGLALNVTPNLKIELGYRYLDMGTVKSGPIQCLQPQGCWQETHSFTRRLPGRPARLALRLRRRRAGPDGSARDQILSFRQQGRTSGARPKARAALLSGFADFRAGPLSPRPEKSGIAGVMSPRRTPVADQEPLPPGGNAPELSVSELANALKRTVEDRFGLVRVRGEVSNYRGPHSSGHVYFSLKDATARLDAVIWKGAFARLKIKPEEGMEVVATGRLTTFPGKSSYQIVIEALEPAGVGALMALLDERRQRLAAEGLFDAERKRPLPFLPRVIGVDHLADRRRDSRHFASPERSFPAPRAGLAGARARRNQRRGGRGGDRRFQRAGSGRRHPASRRADCRARRRLARRSLEL